MEDVGLEDIKRLVALPKALGMYKNKKVELVYGPYGLYVKYDGRNVKILSGVMKKYYDEGELSVEDVVSAIEYVPKTKPKSE